MKRYSRQRQVGLRQPGPVGQHELMPRTVHVQLTAGARGKITAAELRRVASSVLDAEDVAAAVEVEVVLAGEATLRDLNRLYRGKDEPTDVLSFAAAEGEAFLAAPGEAPSLGEVIINVRADGSLVVNRQELSLDELKTMLTRLSEKFKGQAVIVRGDAEATHRHIMDVLDACAGADIWNVSFAAMPHPPETSTP